MNFDQTFNDISLYSTTHPGPILLYEAIVLTVAVALVVWHTYRTRKPQQEDTEMKRRAVLDQQYADAFGDVLFDKLHAGEITRHEYKRDCKRFGIAYRLSDLLVKKNPKRGMRYRIVNNCEVMHRTPRPNLPKEQPKPVAVIVSKRKVWIVGKRK